MRIMNYRDDLNQYLTANQTSITASLLYILRNGKEKMSPDDILPQLIFSLYKLIYNGQDPSVLSEEEQRKITESFSVMLIEELNATKQIYNEE